MLSASLIVRNESKRLGTCLASLRGLVDSMVVVDTGSTDDTAAIAAGFGAAVYDDPWQDDFSHHRNFALSKVQTPWALVIDADEEVVDTDVLETRARLAADGLPDILLVRETLRYPGNQDAMILAPRMLRMSSGIRYVNAVHEQLDVEDGTATLSNVHLLHHGYAEAGDLPAKERRNLRIAEAMPRTPHALHCIARAALSLRSWEKTIAAADELLARQDGSPIMQREVAVLAALAALSAKDSRRFVKFVDAAQRLDPRHIDVQLLQVLAAGSRYAATARRMALDAGPDALRPALLFHDSVPVEAMIRQVTQRAHHSGGPRETQPESVREDSSAQGWR